MSIIYVLALHILHLFYALILRINSLTKRYFTSPPQQLSATRRRVPKHLAIVFAINPSIPVEFSREALTESVVNAVEWCRTIGIKKLTVYEEHDTLSKCTQALCERLPVQDHEVDFSESEVDYPLTPPPSDHSESRPISPSDIPRSCTPITKLRISEKLTQKRPQKEQQKLSRRRQQFHSQSKLLQRCAWASSDCFT
ncbi:hypothetical protein HYPSUDRAFT_520085 [Hypholoma sublateritium FD-334 SS-4]|uniref:ditrans,polycis-polyprenyl diphosphate synthase [(2E,6E)-farnesyldiphosphate specific] n=1 Tax=Hypholoma sublateritium (strain FD-334 SS-4) TaxID=945553 RepID=A0A0D2QCT2_HYPSF|nr:hypothetical protein HYPSUDRAFT_520085 [Hypholoma sublateritium FD-334 SS-4]